MQIHILNFHMEILNDMIFYIFKRFGHTHINKTYFYFQIRSYFFLFFASFLKTQNMFFL
jgi:hypothetical protein